MVQRLMRPDGYRKEAREYHNRSVLQAASRIWVEGVPWDEAMDISRKALERALPKGKGKGKGKARAKGKR